MEDRQVVTAYRKSPGRCQSGRHIGFGTYTTGSRWSVNGVVMCEACLERLKREREAITLPLTTAAAGLCPRCHGLRFFNGHDACPACQATGLSFR